MYSSDSFDTSDVDDSLCQLSPHGHSDDFDELTPTSVSHSPSSSHSVSPFLSEEVDASPSPTVTHILLTAPELYHLSSEQVRELLRFIGAKLRHSWLVDFF